MLEDTLEVHTGQTTDPDWVDNLLCAHDAHGVCLSLGEPVTRARLRGLVVARAQELRSAGLGAGGTVSLRMPPSVAFVVNLLAAWRVGAQVSLLDHRLTDHEVAAALDRVMPQFVISAPAAPGRMPRGYVDAVPVIQPRAGRPAQTGHALLQFSSGSTGTAKVIGRTAANLDAEIERYTHIEGTPAGGERVVLLASMVHVLGLVAGLLYCLHSGVELVLPRYVSTEDILGAVTAGTAPTTIIGVPVHLQHLLAGQQPPRLPQLARVTVAGELVRPALYEAFTDRYRIPLGIMYGMTEVGVIATDLSGEHYPALRPAPGMSLREDDGQLLLAVAESPYVGLTDPGKWSGGWLRTGDAGTVDPATGLVRVLGRLDSQVSVGGLKVDLGEVEQALAALPGVAEAVVVHDRSIEAFVVLDPPAAPAAPAALHAALAERLAPYKLPRRTTIVAALPRTSSGKLIRNTAALRAAASAQPSGRETTVDVR